MMVKSVDDTLNQATSGQCNGRDLMILDGVKDERNTG